MTETIIRLIDQRSQPDQLQSGQAIPASGHLQDTRGRFLRDLRISVTDRCNFRCVYCMPKEVFDKQYRFLPHKELLSFEEIFRIASLLVAHGVEKIRITGGEPLLRKNLEHLIAMLAKLSTPTGAPLDLTLTTNGALLAKKAQALKDAGLRRVTVSLDALSDATFKRMNDVDFAVEQVLHGLQVAHQVGLGPIKVNMVVKAGMNDAEIVPMARYFKDSPFILRFIEYMDVGNSNGWKMDEVIPSAEIISRLQQAGMALQPIGANQTGETASRWQYQEGGGEIGLISSVTQAFCHDCTRLRLSTEGRLYTCLFAHRGHDVRQLMRGTASDAELSNAMAALWQGRQDRYSELRSTNSAPQNRPEMSYIGG